MNYETTFTFRKHFHLSTYKIQLYNSTLNSYYSKYSAHFGRFTVHRTYTEQSCIKDITDKVHLTVEHVYIIGRGCLRFRCTCHTTPLSGGQSQ